MAIAYDVRYEQVRARMCNGGIGRESLIVIAAAMARYADWSTGRNCRPTNTQLAAATGYAERTIQRAHECLRLLGVATEVLRGRQRTYLERMASWRMGDRHRGWASVWALHDNAELTRVIHTLSPHLERSPVTTLLSPREDLITTPRVAGAPRQRGAARRQAPDKDGHRLAVAWRAHPQAPPWARRFTTASWAAMLAAPAAAGWTANDLNQLIRDWLATGRHISADPPKPIGLLGAMLARHRSNNTFDERPAVLDDARDAHELAAARARVEIQAAERAHHAAARSAALAALGGPGHHAAHAIAARAAERAAQRHNAANHLADGKSRAKAVHIRNSMRESTR